MKWIIMLLFSSFAFADLKEHTVNDRARIAIDISPFGANRIMVHRDRISKVIGNENDYFLEGDTLRGHIFITPKQNQSMPATIVTEKGLIQDVMFNVIDTEPTTTLIKKKVAIKKAKPKTSKADNAIFDVIHGRLNNYSIRNLTAKHYKFPLGVTSITEYTSKTFKVKVFECDGCNLGELIHSQIISYANMGNKVITVEKC